MILNNILCLLIFVSSVVMDGSPLKYEFHGEASLIERPLIQPDTLKNDSKKSYSSHHVIAQDFIPIILIAETIVTNLDYLHYLPVYRSARQKEYFLLI